jgi:hypothetical protein
MFFLVWVGGAFLVIVNALAKQREAAAHPKRSAHPPHSKNSRSSSFSSKLTNKAIKVGIRKLFGGR